MLGLKRRFEKLADGEQGVAMAAVVGLMAVGVVLTAVVASSVITASGVTTSVRAGVQSQAAAEAGIARARLGIVANECIVTNNGRFASSGTPEYVATVWIPSGTSWVRGCPSGTATQVRILSTGYAASEGVNGVSARDETSIEVILSDVPQPPTPADPTPTPAPATLVASGPAIYAYSASGFGGSGKLVSNDGSTPSVLVKEGDVSCSGGSSGQADWIVDGGNLHVSGSCNISGSVWVDGAFNLSGGTVIQGSAIASSITVTGSSKIGGSAWSAGNITLSGGGTEVGVNATAGANLSVTGSARVKKNSWVQGLTTLDWGVMMGGDVTTRTISAPQNNPQQFVAGTITVKAPGATGASPYSQPPRPIVADWVEFGYVPADWVGFTEVLPKPTGTCDYGKLTQIVTALAGKKGLVDLRGCSNAISVSDHQKLTLTNDLALVANKFALGGSGSFGATGDHRLWLIVPDATQDGQPTCAANQSFQVGGGFGFDPKLDVMMYSPCRVDIGSSTVFTGQIFAGNVTVAGGAAMSFTAVGLPGVDLDTGLSTATPATPTNPATPPPAPSQSERTVVSSRIVEVGN